MRRAQHVRRLAACGIALAALAVPTAAMAESPVGRPVESNYERIVGNKPLPRDCGFSQREPGRPGQAIWFFCDTPNPNVPPPFDFIAGATVAEGPFTPGRAPEDLSEVPTPPAAIGRLPNEHAPQPFWRAPGGVVLPDGKPCSVPGKFYSASWITGVTQEPAAVGGSKLVLSFVDVCVGGGTIRIERFGLAEYRPATNTVTMTRVFAEARAGAGLPPQLVLGSPIFSKGKLYLFAFAQGSPIFLARTDASPSSWLRAGSYQFFDPRSPGGWTRERSKAASLIPAARPIGISVDDYAAVGHGLALIEQLTLDGNFRLWTAPSPTGPWRSTSGQVPCLPGAHDLCRALIGHPELSSRTELALSYFNPTREHVLLTSTPW